MSIASRITEIEGHITNAYDKIEDLGINLYKLPEDYVPLEYIESTGTQYIDTGVTLFENLFFDVKLKHNSNNSGLIGRYMSSDNQAICQTVYSNKLAIIYGNTFRIMV